MRLTGNLPIFEALAAHYRRLIQQGAFKEGDALPSVREVAMAERINPNTVVRAYALLVEEGYVVSIPKKGYFVHSETKERQSLVEALRSLLDEGYSSDDIASALSLIKEGKA